MLGVFADMLQSHVLPNSHLKGAPTQLKEVSARSSYSPASFDSTGWKRQAPEVDFGTHRRLEEVLANARNAESVHLEDDGDEDDSNVIHVDCVSVRGNFNPPRQVF
jgi:hypothetical protein